MDCRWPVTPRTDAYLAHAPIPVQFTDEDLDQILSGNFVTKVTSERGRTEIEHGATVIAVGAEEYKPSEYLYGEDERVVTHLELGTLIAQKDEAVAQARSVVMIQCVGCRNEDRNYCSRVCCTQAVKNALKLKELNPKSQVTIIYRDIRTYGLLEDYYTEAKRNVQYTSAKGEPKRATEIVVS